MEALNISKDSIRLEQFWGNCMKNNVLHWAITEKDMGRGYSF